MSSVNTDFNKLGDLVELIGRRNYVSIPEAALILGIHQQTMRNMVNTKKVETIKIGSRHKIMLSEVDRLKCSGNLSTESLPKLKEANDD